MSQLELLEELPRSLSPKEQVAFLDGVLWKLWVGKKLEFERTRDEISADLWSAQTTDDVRYAVGNTLVWVETILASVGRKDLLEKYNSAIGTLIASPNIGYYASRDPDRLERIFATTALAEPHIYEVISAFRERVRVEIGSTIHSDIALLDFFYIQSMFSEHKARYIESASYEYDWLFKRLISIDEDDFDVEPAEDSEWWNGITNEEQKDHFARLLATEILTIQEYSNCIPEHFVKKVADILSRRYTILGQFVDEKTLLWAVRQQLETFYHRLLWDLLGTQLANGYKQIFTI